MLIWILKCNILFVVLQVFKILIRAIACKITWYGVMKQLGFVNTQQSGLGTEYANNAWFMWLWLGRGDC